MKPHVLVIALLTLCASVAFAAENHRGVHNFTGEVNISGTLTKTGTGGMTLANGESINTDTDAAFDFTRNTAGTVTLTSSDDDATAAMTVDPGGNATLTLGSASDTVTVAATSGLTLANSESLNAGTDATFDFTRNDAGTVTLTASDSDATAAMTLLPGGAAALTLGGASTTAITLTTDGGSVTVDGTLNGVAPGGITGTPATTGIWTITRDATGIVSVTAADDNAVAEMSIYSGGAADLNLYTGGAGAVNVGNTNATSVSLCNSAACDTILIGNNADADTITIGDATDTTVSITDDNWSITAAGVATFTSSVLGTATANHYRVTNSAVLSAAAVELTKANVQASSFFPVDTSTNAVDVEINAALDAADVGSEKVFVVTTGHATQALTVTADGAGVTTVVTQAATTGTTAEDAGDMIRCTVYATQAMVCVVYAAD